MIRTAETPAKTHKAGPVSAQQTAPTAMPATIKEIAAIW
jgi:hypothetical protein